MSKNAAHLKATIEADGGYLLKGWLESVSFHKSNPGPAVLTWGYEEARAYVAECMKQITPQQMLTLLLTAGVMAGWPPPPKPSAE